VTFSSLEGSSPAGSDRTGTEAGSGQPDPDLPKLAVSVYPLARAEHSTRVRLRLGFRREHPYSSRRNNDAHRQIFEKLIAGEIDKWGKVIRTAGIKPE
jgi:hypothetical protein